VAGFVAGDEIISIMVIPNHLTTTLSVAGLPQLAPETFRLPKPGQRDPYFGLSRTTYYELERSGSIRFIRLRRRGNLRGLTLVPFNQMAELIRNLATEASK
jgi:hypothetical protein